MGRIEAWAAGMDMLKAHPVIGMGKEQFIENYERDSHSSYVRAGAELGFVGLFAFIGIIFSSYRTLSPQSRSCLGDNYRIYKSGFTAYLSSYAVGSIFSTRTYDMIFMIVIALIGVIDRLSIDGLDASSLEGSSVQSEMCAKKVFALTVGTLVVWKIFLIQVW